MKVNEYMKSTKIPLFLKDIENKTFLFDPTAQVKKIKIDVSWKNNERWSLQVLFESQGRSLILTKHALNELCAAANKYPDTIVRIKYEGKRGERKGTHWLFSVVTDEKPLNWSDVMGTTAKQSEPAKERKPDVTTMEGTNEYLLTYKRGMII